ncbi:probable low affinity copper uptake protein 2 [Megalops cyprinoides]|uniref:probable low affinity copper uptake protein 2 n=1 Tax=Megalops cyprinoides TaxID=118141 RepID=UPI001863EA11|nr:probable low affinity copper uptake protein 2 [Megalops cyprinoides]
MSMHFEDSSSVTLLFDFWDVHGPAGMALSVFVVLLLTVFYELLKVWKIWLGERSSLAPTPPPPSPSPSSPESIGSSAALTSIPSETSLAPADHSPTPTVTKSWLLHSIQTVVHVIQVTLGYMLMLCVMSYNVWIFLGVIVGSVLGYFLAFPLIGRF